MDLREKKNLLEEVAKEIAATKSGPFKTPSLRPVPGEGNPDAQIMFIGEAPGFYEDQQGRPFVGVSGKLLRKNIVSIGLTEQEVFITNIAKFRPPENRDPTPTEIEFFKPFLDRQIEIIEPKIIVTVGRFSMYKFFGEGVSIGQIHGQPKKMTWQGKDILVFPMYHPAAALRSRTMMKMFEADFLKLKNLLASVNHLQ